MVEPTNSAFRPLAGRRRPADRWTAVIASVAGLVVFSLGTSAESIVIRAVHGNRPQLEWISDAVISCGVAALTYVWLHLRSSQMRLLAVEREQAALDEQLRLAAEIQRSLLPALPRATPGFRWAARMEPAGLVGGDFYDFLQPRRGVVLAVVADVSGKGIPAALLLSSLKGLFRIIVRDTRDPASIAQRLSDSLYEAYQGAPYVTAIVARLESDPPRIDYANAGHPPGHILRDGTTLALQSGAPPLGLLPDARFVTETLPLVTGDIGVLLTDGVSEALESGPVSLAEALAALRPLPSATRSPAEVCERLLRAAARGGGPAGIEGWQDDRTVLAFSVD